MEALVLYYREEPLRDFPFAQGPIEVGRGPGCDIVVHDPDIADRHLLVRREGGTVVTYALGGRTRCRRHLPLNEPLRVGRHHSLVRIADAPMPQGRAATNTDALLSPPCAPSPGLILLVGRGPEARRACFGRGPLQVGSSSDNDIVLADRAVSAVHCRIDVEPGGARLIDLGSRNGTWVDGVRVSIASLSPGAHIRVGRTDLCLVAQGASGDAREGGLIAKSSAMLSVLFDVERAARLSWPVLVQGESGTGKELVAVALHRRGPRAAGPFVAVNAGAVPVHLVESELFGHERGAFTGAVGVHRGVFEQADGGTLFLDEVGELSLDVQARLLRVLETWQIRRIGGEQTVHVDVRLVCATHRDLRSMITMGTFRQDLYYRLAHLLIDVPALRTRPEDIRALALQFLADVQRELGPRRLSEEAMVRLMAHDWPGNARELRNVVSAAALATAGHCVEGAEVERAIGRLAGDDHGLATGVSLQDVVDRFGGNLAAAARSLGVPRTTLRDRLKEKHGEPSRAAAKASSGRPARKMREGSIASPRAGGGTRRCDAAR